MIVTAAVLGPGAVEAQQDPVGTWSGTLVAGPQQIGIIYHIERAEDGTLSGTMDVPSQGATGIPLTTVSFEDGVLSMTFAVPGGGSYEGTLEGDSITGTFTQGGQPFPMDLERGEGASAPSRPQDPEPPFPYLVEDTRFANDDAGIELAGTLTIPQGQGPFPAAVLVSGSGPQNRDEELAGHRPFLVLADHLTRHGIAVLRYDDRGVAESTGDFSAATSEDFARDALAAVAHLASDARIRTDAIGIVGHSEGGLVGPMAASWSNTVRYVVMLAGPGATGLEILVEQGRLINDAGGTEPEARDFNTRLQTGLAEVTERIEDPAEAALEMRALIERELEGLSPTTRETVSASLTEDAIRTTIQQMNSPWFRYFLHYDPRPALEKTAVPVLALFGTKDLQVPPDQSAGEVESALARGGNEDVTIRTLPGLNHLFQEATTGSPAEYQQIEQTFSPVALSAVSEWISARFGARISDR